MSRQYDILIKKLDKFIRKYYKNQLLRGGIYCLSLLILFFLIVIFAEYFGRFNIITRTIMFYIYLVANGFVLIRFVFIPLFKLFKIGEIISHDQAAEIIGNHFPEVRDKLINTLQLKQLSDLELAHSDLINASIDQKTEELKTVRFVAAIDLKRNKKHLKYIIPPILILLVILISSPTIITEPSSRLVKHNIEFEKPLQYSIEIQNSNLEVVQYDDFRLNVLISGEEVPNELFLLADGNRIRLKKESNIAFFHDFLNLNSNQKFKLFTDQYSSSTYEIIVLPKPIILDFELDLNYPAYTHKKDELISNHGDLLIPIGTEVSWRFYTNNTENVFLNFDNEINRLQKNSTNKFIYTSKFYRNHNYSISSSNEILNNTDSLFYSIKVIPDIYPSISVEEVRDSMDNRRIYFKGLLKDDYGFDRLTFNYTFFSQKEISKKAETETLFVNRTQIPQQFYHSVNIADLALSSGDKVEYYFEVWDNDRINGSKSSKSKTMRYEFPTVKEIDEETFERNKTIKDEMETAIKEAKDLQKEIEKINKELVDKKELNWEDLQQIKQLAEKQKNLLEKIEEIKNENEKKALNEQKFKEVNNEIIEKQQQLEELFEKLMENEDLKELFDELQNLMEEVNKDKVREMMEKMELSNEEMEKMLDRNLEIFKQLEFEQKLEETIKKLENLSEKQDNLSKETLDKNSDKEEVKEEQEEIQEEFNDIKEELEKLDKLNKELEAPNEFEKMENKQSEVDESMENSLKNIEKNNRKKSSDAQESASEQMKKMSESLFAMQQSMIQQSMGEDIESLRDILENLIQLSFDQENLLEKVEAINPKDPRYIELGREQKNIKDNLSMVEDSLIALSKRQIMIEPFVTKEISSINSNIEKAMEDLNNRRTKNAASRQQYVMTSINNLALMLSESLNNMMQMMAQAASGKACKSGNPKDGQGQQSIKSMRQLQEQLNQQIKELKEGNKDGGKKPGGKKGENTQSMSEQLARMAAQQEALRSQLGKYSEQLEKEGEFGMSKELKRIQKEMEQTETDIVNKMITQETLLRQQEIVTRLLRSEKAELKREKEEKRESIESKNRKFRNPEEIFKYNRQQSNEVELLRTTPALFKPYFKSKVNQYFYNFEELLEQ